MDYHDDHIIASPAMIRDAMNADDKAWIQRCFGTVSRRALGATTMLVAMASPWMAAHAGNDTLRTVIPYRAFPGDHVFVPLVGGGGCNAALLDPARPPRIRRTFSNPEFEVYRYEVQYWLRENEDALCGVPPPPPEFYGDVGALPSGSHSFSVTGFLSDNTIATYETTSAWVRVHDEFVPPDVSGLWHDPTQSGRGLSVIPIAYNNVALFWATHDAEGESSWVVSTQAPISGIEIGGLAVSTSGPPLAAGPSVSPTQPWGQVKFTYVGCGRAQFSWTPLDPAIPAGSQALVKLAQSMHESRCAPEAQAQVIWID